MDNPVYTLTKEVLKERADSMRANPTPAEKIFMNRLIDAKIKFSQQFVIHCYIADFIVGNTIIELDGSSHIGREDYDARRDKYLKDRGYKVIRIHNSRAESFDLNRLNGNNLYKPKKAKNKKRKAKSKKWHNIYEPSKPEPVYEMVKQPNGDFVKVHKDGDYKTFLMKGIPYSERKKKTRH